MNRVLRKLNLLLLMISVVAASVFAAHIPPLWGPFALSLAIMSVTIWILRQENKKELTQTNSKDHPVKVFRQLVKDSLALSEQIIARPQRDGAMTEALENHLEHVTTSMEKIHPGLVDALGMKRFIEIILPFARAERLMNRALSALTDGYAFEAQRSLREGLPFLKETDRLLGDGIGEK